MMKMIAWQIDGDSQTKNDCDTKIGDDGDSHTKNDGDPEIDDDGDTWRRMMVIMR